MKPRHLPVVLLALALPAAILVALSPASRAEGDKDLPHTVFLHVTGEGPNSKAWYKGAPPTGVPVQDALDTFSEKGYRVVEISSSARTANVYVQMGSSSPIRESTSEEQFFVILMER